MAVDVARDGEAALRKAHARRYDVVVLDRNLPLVHGDEVCPSLVRNRPQTRVLMLVHRDISLDTVAGIARRAGRTLPLTRKEREVLEHLLRAEGGLVSADELLEHA